MRKAEIIKRLNDILEVLEMDCEEMRKQKAAENSRFEKYTTCDMYPVKCGIAQAKIKILLKDI